MYKKIAITFLVLIVLSKVTTAQTASSPAREMANKIIMHHIIIQLTSNDSLVWRGLMNNVKHLQDEWPGKVQIEVVSHGPGIEMMMITTATQQTKIAELKKSGVVFAVCENSMRARNLTKDDIIPDGIFVHSGVVEIITKEEKGWSYLKSGF